MRGHEALQARDEPARAEGRLGADGQDLGFAAVGQDGARGHVHLVQDRPDLGLVERPRRRQLQAAPHAQEQRIAQQRLELRDLLADRALGHVQFLGRARKTHVPRHRFEALERHHRRHQTLFHGAPL
ncbi:hypothetical protein D3C72_1852760 [compost metagenome]